jgi:hypothetical protein
MSTVKDISTFVQKTASFDCLEEMLRHCHAARNNEIPS